MTIIETERLVLRTWKNEDAEQYYNINQDPKVMEFLIKSPTMEEVRHFMDTFNRHQKQYGYSLWATELKETSEMMGFIGIAHVPWESHFTPAVEVGWRLGSQYWEKGYATEGAMAALEYGFNHCGLKEIVSFTVPMNTRSLRVMEKIGMKRNQADDFAHPKLPLNHKFSKHVLYRTLAPQTSVLQ